MTSIRRLLLSCFVSICVLLAGAVIPNRAIAESAPPAQPASFADLADAIKKGFPLAGAEAVASKDWCVEIESDANSNWWHLRFNNSLDAHEAKYDKRIRMIYTKPTTNKDKPKDAIDVGYASIFLAMDFRQSYDYGSTQQFQISSAKEGKLITLPHRPDGVCPDLSETLPVMFTEEAQYWIPLGNPLCTDPTSSGASTCHKLSIGNNQELWEKQKSQNYGSTDKNDLLHWNFLGRDHAIPGAMRFLVKFCSKECSDSSATITYGYLIVGYGGAGGAG